MSSYSPELKALLDEALGLLNEGNTILLMFEDMYIVNEHFQATLDYFKKNGNRMTRRFGNGAFMQKGGVAYFVGADTHKDAGPTRGVAKEFDLTPFKEELVREKGLESRLRDKGIA
jgi:uncharacterized protein YaaQ